MIRATDAGGEWESLLGRWVAASSFDVVVRRVARKELAYELAGMTLMTRLRSDIATTRTQEGMIWGFTVAL